MWIVLESDTSVIIESTNAATEHLWHANKINQRDQGSIDNKVDDNHWTRLFVFSQYHRKKNGLHVHTYGQWHR
ncbi:hypothetical protein BC826DRAFT_1034723 [Russula brevipes]|nr:hypothetical protein BC826DRAFT_1034723 [Russula brevipes]